MDFPILWQVILVPIIVAESFETFLMDNGIKHGKTTPLWPRPMVRLKAKKRSLLKRMLKAQVEGKDWKEAVMKYHSCLSEHASPKYRCAHQSCCLKGSWVQNSSQSQRGCQSRWGRKRQRPRHKKSRWRSVRTKCVMPMKAIWWQVTRSF